MGWQEASDGGPQAPRRGDCRSGLEKPTSNSEINITPFIDVLLVLIVIFLAALPVEPTGLGHQPATRDAVRRQEAAADSSQIVLEYTADRRISINNQDVTLPVLQSRLREIL